MGIGNWELGIGNWEEDLAIFSSLSSLSSLSPPSLHLPHPPCSHSLAT
ncbi:MAG: hypothetical protein F6K47_29315 [Symploca sp. SIO2E6]|nr:hypothetical protein [Symploca sp. SIO2E6]